MNKIIIAYGLKITFKWNDLLPRVSRVRTISFTTSGESLGYKEDLSLHLNTSPEDREANLAVLMDSVEALLPKI